MRISTLVLALVALAPLGAQVDSVTLKTSAGPPGAEAVTGALTFPWSVAWLPDGPAGCNE